MYSTDPDVEGGGARTGLLDVLEADPAQDLPGPLDNERMDVGDVQPHQSTIQTISTVRDTGRLTVPPVLKDPHHKQRIEGSMNL